MGEELNYRKKTPKKGVVNAKYSQHNVQGACLLQNANFTLEVKSVHFSKRLPGVQSVQRCTIEAEEWNTEGCLGRVVFSTQLDPNRPRFHSAASIAPWTIWNRVLLSDWRKPNCSAWFAYTRGYEIFKKLFRRLAKLSSNWRKPKNVNIERWKDIKNIERRISNQGGKGWNSLMRTEND